MKHEGSCHCGRIAFEVEGDIGDVIDCNCSLWFVPREALALTTPEGDLSTYTFNKHHICHHFCAVCGIAPFGEAAHPKTGMQMAAVNVRCLPDVDLAGLRVNPFDGAAL